MELKPINQRLAILIYKREVSAHMFSEMIGEKSSNTQNHVGARNSTPGADYIEKVLRHFESINPVWLLLGEGEPFKDGAPTAQNQINISGNRNNVASGKTARSFRRTTSCPIARRSATPRAQLNKAQREVELLTGQLQTKDALIASKGERRKRLTYSRLLLTGRINFKMNKQLTTSLLTGGLFLLITGAQAQATFRIGPKASYALSAVSYSLDESVVNYGNSFRSTSTAGSFGSGFEAGVLAQVGFGSFFSVQPAILYARKSPGYRIYTTYQPSSYNSTEENNLSLNYLTVPINFLFSQRPGGQGAQAFLGPYMGWLLGGTYRSTNGSGGVKPGDTYATTSGDTNYYLRRFDAGLQIGVGYGFSNELQLQVSFSQGLRNIGAAYAPNTNISTEAPAIRNYGFQLSAAYLFGSKN